MAGDGCNLPFADGSYDMVFSNSVIEHVGTWEQQQAFAREARRVGRKLWIQTPAFECPVEPHYIAPFVHYLPRSVQKATLRWCTPWGWLQKPTKQQVNDAVDSTRLLSKREFRELFPDCEILTERLAGILPKSYIAIRL
jgi:ubiquinone/menaquinone biosynthesis C-methylase UbiE